MKLFLMNTGDITERMIPIDRAGADSAEVLL